MTGRDEKGLPASSLWERRLIGAARRGDRQAQAQLLGLCEPLVRALVRGLYLRGGEREDLAQHARLGIAMAVRDWDPARRVPFRSFARLYARREVRDAYKAACSCKHRPLNHAFSQHWAQQPADTSLDVNYLAVNELACDSRPDEDPVLKTLARERLREIRDRVPTLSTLERDALALSANDHSYREIAGTLGVSQRAVNNALQRARGKLVGRVAA